MGTSSNTVPSLSIGYLSPGWPPEAFSNGIVTAIGTLTPALRAMGHRVTIFTANLIEKTHDDSVYDLAQFQRQAGAARRTLVRIGYRIFPESTGMRVMVQSILGALRRAEAERGIQIFEIEDSFGWARGICRKTSIPICVRLHGPWFLNGLVCGEPQDAEFRRRVAREGEAIRAATAVTAPSSDVLERVRAFYGLPLPDARVIPGTTPAVSADQRWRLEAAEPHTVLFVGRFDRHKGGDLIVEAFGQVLRQVPEARLWMVGRDQGYLADDGRKWMIEEFVRDRVPGALEAGRIRSFGFQSRAELDQLRRAAMVTVVCSRYETFGSTVIEAMSMGCPIVAARVGGIPEIVQHDVNGLMHHSEDSTDLAAKIIDLLNRPSRAACIGHEAAKTFEQRYHPHVIAGRFVEFYSQVIRARQRKSLRVSGAVNTHLS